MTPYDDLEDLAARYVYTRDTRDRWTLLTAASGPLEGDCEDWAYSVLWRVAGRSWRRFWAMVLRGEAMLWWTRFHGTGEAHVMLWVADRGWTDSYHRAWSPVAMHPPLKPYGPVKLALTLRVK